MQWFEFVLNCYLAAPQPTLGHYRGSCLTNPMLITAFFTYFNPKLARSLVTRLCPKVQPSIKWGLNQNPSHSECNSLTLDLCVPKMRVNLKDECILTNDKIFPWAQLKHAIPARCKKVIFNYSLVNKNCLYKSITLLKELQFCLSKLSFKGLDLIPISNT